MKLIFLNFSCVIYSIIAIICIFAVGNIAAILTNGCLMVDLQLFGINEVEIVNTALFEYRQSMLSIGNLVRATLVSDILDRVTSPASVSSSVCSDDCEHCANFLDLKECGYEVNCSY